MAVHTRYKEFQGGNKTIQNSFVKDSELPS